MHRSMHRVVAGSRRPALSSKYCAATDPAGGQQL
jgi:hypothetical protein